MRPLQSAVAVLLLGVLLVHGAAAVAVPDESGDEEATSVSTERETWTYRTRGDDWATGECQSSRFQSPVNIENAEGEGGADSKAIDFHYPVCYPFQNNIKLMHNGHAIVVDASRFGGLGYIVEKAAKFPVREIVFHAPSEHQVRGETFPMEMQIVHQRAGARNEFEGLIVVSVLFRNSTMPNAFLRDVLHWQNLPKERGKQRILTDTFQLGQAVTGLHQGYYEYTGSITTPPCTADVSWRVLESIQEMSSAQIESIRRVFAANKTFAAGEGNSRRVQPLNGRLVVLHNHKQRGDGDNRGIPLVPGDQQARANPEAYQSTSNQLDVDPEDAPPSMVRTEEQNRQAARTSNFTGIPILEPDDQRLPELYRKHGADWTGMCKTSRTQSPIDLRLGHGNPHGDYEMSTKYAPTMVAGMKNAGFTFKVQGNFGVMRLGPDEFVAHELTFHSPSEHTIDGRRSALEVQIIHALPAPKAADNVEHLAILSVLFHESQYDESAFLNSLNWGTLPHKGNTSPIPSPVDLNKIKGIDQGYYSYAGSESFPPCRQGVKRFVLRTYQEISSRQLRFFRRFFYGNVRELQPLNGRGVAVHNINSFTEVLPRPKRYYTDKTLAPQ